MIRPIDILLMKSGSVAPSAPYLEFADAFSSITIITGLGFTVGSTPPESLLFGIFADGLSLASGNITVTPSANLQFWNGSTWQSTPLTFPYTGGAVATPITGKVRINPSATANTYNETLTLSTTAVNVTSWVINCSGVVAPANEFKITVKTNNAGTSGASQFTLPLYIGKTYNCIIDWGDASTTVQTTAVSPTHTYASAGTYQIKISGTFPAILFNNGGDKLKLLSIDNWGIGTWSNLDGAFNGCANMVANYVDIPNTSAVTSLAGTFQSCTLFNGSLAGWNTSNVTTLMQCLWYCTSFNQSLNTWDVSHVTTMQSTFQGCSAFNQPLNSWVTTSLTNLTNTFYGCSAFNQNIDTWDVSHVTGLSLTFTNCTVFNQPLNSWVTTNVTTLNSTFANCYAFNQPLSAWDVSHVTTMNATFQNCRAFNQNLSAWNTGLVTIMTNMFNSCWVFNGSLTGWDTSHVTSMYYMFGNCYVFNQSINGWNVSSVTTIDYMFFGCAAFNQPLGSWTTSSLITMIYTFYGATVFNQSINSWDVSHVTTMVATFYNCTAFNQDLDLWDVTNVTNMSSMFYNCTAFKKDISMWNIVNVLNFTGFMAGKSAANYTTTLMDAIYNTWSTLTVKPNLSISFGTIKYTAGSAAGKAILVGAPNNWTITDGGI